MFITFEGGEGAGKSTLLNKLVDHLQLKGLPVVQTREPGGTALGQEIRRLLLQSKFHAPIAPLSELFLILAARVQHIKELIAPSLNAGMIVLCDRFNDSTIAYQSGGRGLSPLLISSFCEAACDGVLPDLTFYVDIEPHIGLERTRRADKDEAAEGQVDRIESEEIAFHERVRQAFLDLSCRDKERIVVLDGRMSREQLFEQAKLVLDKKIESSRSTPP